MAWGTSGFSAVLNAEADQADAIRKVNRHLIPWFFALATVCYLDRTNLSFAAVQLSADLGFSCATYGLGAGLFFLGYSFQVPSTMVTARLGAPLWLSATAIIWGLVAVCFSLTTSRTMFLSLRVALGLAECGTFPGIWLHLSKFYTERELGAAYATIATSTALAQVIGAPLAAGILSLNGLLGLRGWQWLFIFEGITTIVFAAFLRYNLAPTPMEARFLTDAQKDWLQQRQDSQPTSFKGLAFTDQLKAVVGTLNKFECIMLIFALLVDVFWVFLKPKSALSTSLQGYYAIGSFGT